MQGFQILRLAPDTGRANSSADRQSVIPDLDSFNVALAPEQDIGHIDAHD